MRPEIIEENRIRPTKAFQNPMSVHHSNFFIHGKKASIVTLQTLQREDHLWIRILSLVGTCINILFTHSHHSHRSLSPHLTHSPSNYSPSKTAHTLLPYLPIKQKQNNENICRKIVSCACIRLFRKWNLCVSTQFFIRYRRRVLSEPVLQRSEKPRLQKCPRYIRQIHLVIATNASWVCALCEMIPIQSTPQQQYIFHEG